MRSHGKHPCPHAALGASLHRASFMRAHWPLRLLYTLPAGEPRMRLQMARLHTSEKGGRLRGCSLAAKTWRGTGS